MLSVVTLTIGTQILAVVSGFLVLAGCLFLYLKTEIEDFYVFIFALAGLGFIAYGIGGEQLFKLMNN